MGFPLNNDNDFPLLPSKKKTVTDDDFPLLKVDNKSGGSQQPIPMADTKNIQSIIQANNEKYPLDEGGEVLAKISKRDEAIHNTIERNNESQNKPTDKNSQEYQQQFGDLIQKEKNNDVKVTEAKDGKPFVVPTSGFWHNAGVSFIQSLKAPFKAINHMMMSDKELSDYFERKALKQPYLPKDVPSDIGGLGGVVGGLPKIVAELAIPYVGEAVAAAETELSSTGRQTEELYHRNISELSTEKYNKLINAGVNPEDAQKQIEITPQEKEQAASKAKKDAPLAALPDAAMVVLLNRMGGNPTKLNQSAETFRQSFNKYIGSVGKLSAIGGVSESARSGILALQGYNVTPEEAINKFGEGAYTWGLMDAMIKLAPIMGKGIFPKRTEAQWKDYMSQVPKPVFEEEISKLGKDGDEIKEAVDKFAEAKQIVHPDEETTPQPNVTAITEQPKEERQTEIIQQPTDEPVNSGNELISSKEGQPNEATVNKVEQGTQDVKTISEHDLKNGDKIIANIGGKKENGIVTGVGKHHGRIVIDFKDSNGDERFVYEHQIESIEKGTPELPKSDNFNTDQRERRRELLSKLVNGDDFSAKEMDDFKALEDIKDGKNKQLPKPTPITETEPTKVGEGTQENLVDKNKNVTLTTNEGANQNISKEKNQGNENYPRPLDEKSLKEKLSQVEDVTDPHDKVMQYFANDGKIHSSAINELFGGKNEKIRIKSSTENERRARISLLGKDAPSIDKLAHQLWEGDETGKYTTQDYKEAIENVLQNFNSKSAMAKDLVERYDTEAAYQKFIDQNYPKEIVEQAARIADNLNEEEINHILSLESDEKREQELEDYIDNLPTQTKNTEEEKQIISQPINKTEEPTAQPEKPLQEGVNQGDNTIGARHESLNKVADRLGLPPIERGTFLSPEEQLRRGRRLLEGGADPQQVANDFRESGKVSADEISVARAHQEKLATIADNARNKSGTNSEEYKAALKDYKDWSEQVIKPMGTASGAAMSSLQGETDLNTGSFISVRSAVEHETGKPANAEQEKKIGELTKQNSELQKRAEEAEKKLIEATNENIGKGGKKSYTEKAKDVANRFRKLKQKPFTFKDENGNDITPQIQGVSWNDLVEFGAKAIEKTGKIADGIAAIVDKIKDAEWYVKLSDKDKAAFAQKLNEHFGESAPITERFADKHDNKFSTEDAKDIWSYAKENYLDKGTSYRDMISFVSDDLGLSWRQVNEAISSPKTKRISDEMWKRQADYRKIQNVTKNWVGEQNKSFAGRTLKKVSGVFRGTAVFGHGGIFVGTHAGMTLFQPSTWTKTIPAFFRGWKYAYGNEAAYERAMEELKNRNNYTLAQRAGLKNNPDQLNAEEYQKSQMFLGKIGNAGKKGFNAIKVLRQDLFDFHYNKLSAVDKTDPEVIKSIARLVNNATGASNLNIPEWVNEATFAGGMEAARWGKLTRNPVEATSTALKAIFTPNKVSASEKVFAKVWARRVGEQLATYVGLLTANAAIQNIANPKNPVNILHPSQSDWMRFKFGDITLDPTSGMLGVMNFIKGLVTVSTEDQKQLRGDTRLQAIGKNAVGYGRGKLAPLYSTVVDVATQSDFYGNPLPFSSDKPRAGKHTLTWGEYAWEKAPIPISEAAKVTYQSAIDNGLTKPQIDNIFKGILSGAISGSTGFRVGEFKEKPTAYDDTDKKDQRVSWIYNDWKMELPNTVASSEKITDEENQTLINLDKYPKPKQDEYIAAHKENLFNILGKIHDDENVYVKNYKDENGNPKNKIKIPSNISEKREAVKEGYEQKDLKDLSEVERTYVLREAQKEATDKTKKDVFNKK